VDDQSNPSGQMTVTRRLEQSPPWMFAAWAIAAAFSTYFCMYAFRKPFAVATWSGTMDLPLVGMVDQKIIFITSQVIGYCTSKFWGIKLISEMGAQHRGKALVLSISMAWLALVLFALVPPALQPVCLFFNGLPLGVIWGLVFGYLEGRRLSEVLGAGLSASYIVASGTVKTIGRWLLQAGVSEVWMPALVGAMFYLPMLFFIWMLSRLPPPTAEDIALRTERKPMDAQTRRRFVVTYLPGVASLTTLYVFLTAYRDFRDNFAREIWDAIGFADQASIMTTAELPIAVAVLLVLAGLARIRDNRKALLMVHAIMIVGSALIGLSTLAWQAGWISPAVWMISVGLGLYIGYVPFGCVLFDRLIAAVGFVGTAGFLIYVTDAFGYLGSVVLLLFKNFGKPDLSWLDFFVGFSYVTAVLTGALFAASMIYFARQSKAEVSSAPSTA